MTRAIEKVLVSQAFDKSAMLSQREGVDMARVNRSYRLPALASSNTPLLIIMATLAGILTVSFLSAIPMIDDAYIQFQYARQLANHGNWGILPDSVANTSTSALNVVLLALTSLLTGSVVGAARVLTALEFAVLFFACRAIALRLSLPFTMGVIIFIALLMNPLLLSTLGLESLLFVTLFMTALWLFLRGEAFWLGLVLGLLILTRPDGLLLAFLMLLTSGTWTRRLLITGSLVGICLPWFLFSWFGLGGLLPDTLLIKAGQLPWGGHTFANGLFLYTDRYARATLASIAFMPFALAAWNLPQQSARRIARLCITYGLLHFLGYSLLRVPPYHWYYIHQVAPLTIAGLLGLDRLLIRLSARHIIAASLPLGLFLFTMGAGGFTLEQPAIHSNWATEQQYSGVSDWLKQNVSARDTIWLKGEIGTLTYGSGLQLLNEFSDQNIVTARYLGENAGPVGRLLYARRTKRALVACPSFVLEQRGDAVDILLVQSEGAKYDGVLVKEWGTSSNWTPESRVYLWRVTPQRLVSEYPGGCRAP